ncbi:hypothetical protein EBU91_05235 [bacterium]|nr:hypothetical protein [bacterium]
MGFIQTSEDIKTLYELEQVLDDKRVTPEQKMAWVIETLYANETLANNVYLPKNITIQVKEKSLT